LQKLEPDATLIGANGNIFILMVIASHVLHALGMREQAAQMFQRFTASGSYRGALKSIGEYANFTDAARRS